MVNLYPCMNRAKKKKKSFFLPPYAWSVLFYVLILIPSASPVMKLLSSLYMHHLKLAKESQSANLNMLHDNEICARSAPEITICVSEVFVPVL